MNHSILKGEDKINLDIVMTERNQQKSHNHQCYMEKVNIQNVKKIKRSTLYFGGSSTLSLLILMTNFDIIKIII